VTSKPVITKHRVHVIHGKYRNCKGWAFFAEGQMIWDSVSVQLDHDALPATGPVGSFPMIGSAVEQAALSINGQRNVLVRLHWNELRVLSDLEALAELS